MFKMYVLMFLSAVIIITASTEEIYAEDIENIQQYEDEILQKKAEYNTLSINYKSAKKAYNRAKKAYKRKEISKAKYKKIKKKYKMIKQKCKKAEYAFDDMCDNYDDYMSEYCFSHNDLRSFSYIYSNFYDYDEDEYYEICQRWILYLCEDMGIENIPSLSFETTETDSDLVANSPGYKTYGYYNFKKNEIVINKATSDAYTLVTIAHECRHAWQHENGFDFSSYVSPDKSYTDYREQESEKDAREYEESQLIKLSKYYNDIMF